jgi:hypothetical protein
MSKHTPGPWRELVTRIDDANGYQICHLDLHGKSEAERDANRRLIAAAPELLSHLKFAVKLLDGFAALRTTAQVEAMRAVIKKAEDQA